MEAHQYVGVEGKSGGSLELEEILSRQENVAKLLNLWNKSPGQSLNCGLVYATLSISQNLGQSSMYTQ